MERIVIPISDPNYQMQMSNVSKLVDKIMLANEQSLINYGKHAEGLPIEYYRVTLIQIWREAIEIADGIKSLIIGSSCNLISILLRSLFELQLGIDFIYSDKSKIKQRALSYNGVHLIKRIENYKKFDINESECEDFRNCLGKNVILEISSKFDAKSAISNLESIFIKYPEYKEFKQEYDRIVREKTKRGRKQVTPEWYELFDGSSSIFALASKLNMKKYYVAFYDPFSEKGHGLSAMKSWESGHLKNPKIPDLKLLGENVDLLLSFITGISTKILKHEFSGEYKNYAIKHLKLREEVDDLRKQLESITYVVKSTC